MTAATLVTLSRIAFLPLFLFFLLNGSLRLAFLLFLFLVGTDWLDGWMAREWKQKSNLGAILDPLADKFLVLGGLIAMVELGMVGAVPVVLLMCRELAVTAFRGLAAEQAKILPARFPGKVKAVLEYAAILFLLLGWPGGTFLLWGAVWVAIFSAYPYVMKR